jgi:hypothetical protein
LDTEKYFLLSNGKKSLKFKAKSKGLCTDVNLCFK